MNKLKKMMAICTVLCMVVVTMMVPMGTVFAEGDGTADNGQTVASNVTANGEVVIEDQNDYEKNRISFNPMNEPRPYNFSCAANDRVTMTVTLDGIDENTGYTVAWHKGDGLDAVDLNNSSLTYTVEQVSEEEANNGMIYKCLITINDANKTYIECTFGLGFGDQGEGGGEGGLGCYEGEYVYGDVMIVNYVFTSEEGKDAWVPKTIELNGTMTFETAINQAMMTSPDGIAPTNHFNGFANESGEVEVYWNIEGTTYGWNSVDDIPYDQPATGGEITLYADYGAKKLIIANVIYYDAIGNQQKIQIPVVPDENDTGQDVYDEVIGKISTLSLTHKDGFKNNWTALGCDLNESADMIDSLTIAAQYEEYDVDLIYTYLDNNVVKTKTKTITIDAGSTDTIEAIFRNNVPADLSADTSITDWIFDQQCIPSYIMGPVDDVLNESISPATTEIRGAAVYENTSPVEVSYYPIRYDKEAQEYYTPHEVSEIIYVNAAMPEGSDQEGGDGQSNGSEALFAAFEQKVVEKATADYTAKHGSAAGDYRFQGFRSAGGNFIDGFIPRSQLHIEYDKILIILELPGGSKEYRHINPNENNNLEYLLPAKCTVGSKDIEISLWTKEVANMGGMAVPGGTIVKLNYDSPYVLFSAYDIVIDDLPANKADAKHPMKEKALGAANWKDKNHVSIHYYDVKLVRKDADGQRVEVEHDDFPANGQVVYMPYPQGTDKNTKFIITHRIEDGPDAGKIEVLQSRNCDQGIRIVPKSLSPIAVAYGDIVPGASGNSSTDTTTTGTQTPAKGGTTDTGDNFSAIPYIAAMVIAAVGAAAALFRKKAAK